MASKTHGKVRRNGSLITALSVALVHRGGTRGRLLAPGLSLSCAIGRSGLTRFKREGDGATPAGTLAILGGFYRPDRFLVRPRSALPLRPLRTRDGWGDEPSDPGYNRPVRRPYPASHEAMWRDDGLYDIVLVLDWNLAPKARHRGSAIFFHLSRPDFTPTAGCLAVTRGDMLKILARLAPGATVRFE